MLEAVVRFRDAAGCTGSSLPGFGINLARKHPPETAPGSTGDAMLAGAAGAVIPDFGVAEEHAR